MSIHILPPDVVDQISAGEVVERPSHMVKELIENSIDAGATEIEVEFAQGGRWVRIQDNGSGMTQDDLLLCLARHATSKIEKSMDIWALDSFGFRGEALASISSVCRMTITTKRKQDEVAYQLKSEFGKRDEIAEVGGEVGTSIQVEELFDNMPVRLKFLKSEAAESTAIKNTLKALAMANPNVGFRVRQKGKLLFYWSAKESSQKRVEEVMEREPFYTGEGECDGLRAKVVISSPNMTQKNSRQIWLFVQGRWVQDRSLQTAVMEGYRSLLMHGEYPFAAVWLSCDASEVDVNIHPTKSQVKFRVPSSAFRSVSRAVRSVLEDAPWLAELLPNLVEEKKVEELGRVVLTPKNSPAANLSFSTSDLQRVQFAQKEFSVDLSKESFQGANIESLGGLTLRPSPDKAFVKSPVRTFQTTQPQESSTGNGFSSKWDSELQSSVAHGDELTMGETAADKTDGSPSWSQLHVLGQAKLTYIIAQSDRSIIYVDQHAAHERVVYEKLMKQWKAGEIEVQSFLLPFEVILEEEFVEAVISQEKDLAKMGLQVSRIDGGVALNSAPAIIKDSSLKQAVEELAFEIHEKGGSFAFERYVEHIFATMACHSVVRAGQALSGPEMESLLVQMDEFPLSSFCPHGRPVYVEYPFSRLEKDFGRLV